MRLESASITRIQGLDVLLDTARSLNDGDPLDVVLEQLARAAARAVWRGAGEPGPASVWRLRGSHLSLEAETGEVRGRAIAELPLTADMRRALEGRRAIRLKGTQIPAVLRNRYEPTRPESIAVVPLLSYTKTFGLITAPLETGPQEAVAAEADLKLLGGIAELGGLAIAAAADFDLELRLAVAFELLPQMITGASGAEDADEAASVIVTRVGEVPGVDRVTLFMRGDLKRGLWIKASTDSVNVLRVEQDEGAVAQAVRDRQIMVVNDGHPWASEQDALIAADSRHLLAVPVCVTEEVIGLVVITSRQRPFSATDVQIATVLVSALTGLLEGVRLRDELSEAQRTLRSFYHGLACGAVTHDGRGRVMDANWAAENLSGIPLKQLIKEGIFGPDWVMEGENGLSIPLPLRPPESVLKSGRPVHGMRARVTPPGGDKARWLRIDSRPIEEGGRLKCVITTFFETVPPTNGRRRASGSLRGRAAGAATS
jgi:PAS domain-containing protein